MSITKHTDRYAHRDRYDNNFDWTVECDTGDSPHCEGARDLEDLTFMEAIGKIKEYGWQVFKDPRTQEWTHRCHTCREHKKKAAFENIRREVHEED